MDTSARKIHDEKAPDPITFKQKNLLTENLREALPDVAHRTMLTHNGQHYIGVEQPEEKYIFIDGEGRVTDMNAVHFFQRRDIDDPAEHHRGFVFVSNMSVREIFENEGVYTKDNFMLADNCCPTDNVVELLGRVIAAIVATFPELDLPNKPLIHTSIRRAPFKYHHLHLAIPTNLKGDLLTITFAEWMGYEGRENLRGDVSALQPQVRGQQLSL